MTVKTYQQHLEDLPDPKDSAKALKNMWWEDRDSKCTHQSYALRNAFNWSRSPEGYMYWFMIYSSLLNTEHDEHT